MSKVIGCRVTDDIYEQIKKQGRPSFILQRLIHEYISKKDSKGCKQPVNEESIVYSGQYSNLEREAFKCPLLQYFKKNKGGEKTNEVKNRK
jgi:hypothetical protein